MKTCPYGGQCIDPGEPSDCDANGYCVNFTSIEERKQFDEQPDRYYYKYPQGGEVRFKNQNQLNFLLTDLPASQKQGGEWGTINPVTDDPPDFE